MPNALPWIRVDTALEESGKLDHLEALLDIDDALPIVVRLWSWVGKVKPYGILSGVFDSTIAKRVRWRGDAAELVTALVTAGFLAGEERARLVVSWWDHQRAYLKKRDGDEAVRAEAEYRRLLAEIEGVPHEEPSGHHEGSSVDPPRIHEGTPDRSIDRSIDQTNTQASEPKPKPPKREAPPGTRDAVLSGLWDKHKGADTHPRVLKVVAEAAAELTGSPVTLEAGTERRKAWRKLLKEAGSPSAGLKAYLGLRHSRWHRDKGRLDVHHAIRDCACHIRAFEDGMSPAERAALSRRARELEGPNDEASQGLEEILEQSRRDAPGVETQVVNLEEAINAAR